MGVVVMQYQYVDDALLGYLIATGAEDDSKGEMTDAQDEAWWELMGLDLEEDEKE
jgi:hypothetical protein